MATDSGGRVEKRDEELIREAAAGDREAFRALFARYERPILNFAHRLGARPDEAEEVVQETFLRILRHGARYDPSRPARPWIYTVAANICRARFVKYSRALLTAADLDRRAGNGHAPPTLAHASEIGEAVRAAVAALSEEQRVVFVLARYQGLDYPEIAETVGIPVGSVKSRMYRAVRALRDRLKGLLP